jgi:hypothetical protein
MRLLFVIPTTGGPLVVTALRPRPGLPVSAAFAEGDFRGLPWSGDYGRLCAPGGPLSCMIPQLAPHELRLSASFDAGRSWEAPIALAHLMLARGHTCAARPADAEAMIWATGAIDLDLAPIGGDYALSDKIEKTAALLAAVPETTPIFVVLPPAPDAEAAWTRFQAIAKARPVTRIAAAPMAEVAAALLKRMAPAASAAAALAVGRKTPPPVRWPAMAAVVVAVAVVGGFGTYALNRATSELQDRPEPAPQHKPVAAVDSRIAENPQDHDPPKPAPSPRVVISEIRAAPGSDCRRVLFVPSAAVRHAVSPLDDTTFTPSRLEDTLCGIAIKPVVATDRFTLEGDLVAASLAPTVGPDGATTYLLRANRQQNIVYQIQVSGETASGQPRMDVIRHAIIR